MALNLSAIQNDDIICNLKISTIYGENIIVYK